MAGRIDYDIEKYQFTEAGETPRLREQWREVYLECRQLRAGAEERLRIALLNVDYVTSFELPFRLLLVRAPQLIADVRETLQLSRKAAVFNGIYRLSRKPFITAWQTAFVASMQRG
ncbi:DNA-binding protein [Klebsiella pneumoniae]|nr:DNA-binding protein [Klebsiella pneumoniae]SWI87997.1 DNA-binding protein [Klebsiella pneumoniae]SWJ16979.1 DNA-binding protein [Klebsiella pneumoniae]